MRGGVTLTLAVVLLAAAAAARRAETDFEFDDDAAQSGQAQGAGAAAASRRPRRYVYDPHNPLCEALSCGAHATCVLRDAFTALCADRAEILRQGDIIVSGGSGAWGGGGGGGREDDDDVFYEAGDRETLAPPPPPAPAPRDLSAHQDLQKLDRCVGCSPGAGGGRGAAARSSFVCGSDNRTYSSLCRLDLHNCVRRPHPPVAPACPGFCPCAAAGAPPRARRQHARTRARAQAPAPPAPPRRSYDEYEDDNIATDAPAFPKEWWRRQAESQHNEVLPDRDHDLKRDRARARDHAHEHEHDEHNKRRRLNKVWAAEEAGGGGTEACSLAQLADRLVDWFSVLMERAGEGAAPPPARGFPPGCKPEVRWMFAHLDQGADGRLDTSDLYALRHDEREQCLRPFLAMCGGSGGGGGGGGVTRAAWCGCLRRAARPCTALARAHPARRAARAGGYVPACDARGFYRARQCHPALGVCWCVTPHGVERPGTRTKGAPACAVHKSSSSTGDGEEEGGAPADDEDAVGEGAGAGEGSGDGELPF